ncbi:MAG: CopG family transcriptional regulator [Caulobacteraceae bacterium]|nr:CopG family transcriptional regulator [Caulobacteraceae bacterium]
MARPPKKSQISVYLDPDVTLLLAAFAARTGRSMSQVAEAALASFLSPDAEVRREAAIAKRIDRIDRRLDRLERDAAISLETLALFVRLFLNATPPLPDQASQAARAKAAARYEHFVTAVGRRVRQGPKLRQEILDDVGPDGA